MKQLLPVLFLLIFLTSCKQESPAPLPPAAAPSVFEKTYIDTHNGYSEAVVITTSTQKTIYISGQIGEGEDMEAQMRDALFKMEDVLRKSGAGMKDVIKMNTYIVDYGPESLEVFREVRKSLLGDSDMPASTLVGVDALALPEWLIEIEAVAVLPIP